MVMAMAHSKSENDYGDGDGTLEVGERWVWNMPIIIENVSSVAINGVMVQDNLGGDLGIWLVRFNDSVDPIWIDVPTPTNKKYEWSVTDASGTETIKILWTGKTLKPHIWWEVGDLTPGETDFIQIGFYTDINTGTGNGKKAGHQEYTSEGPTELNSGATAKGLLDGWFEVEAESESIDVDVQPFIEGSSPAASCKKRCRGGFLSVGRYDDLL